ncbi:MAG: branched-chain amino acid ABC transporter permease [Microbacteriaceae bacterium]
MQLVVQGILLGGMYAAAALGLSLVFGTMRLVNLAHGQFLVIGAYLTSVLIGLTGADPLLVALPAAVAVGLVAYPIQRYILTPVMPRGDEAPIAATFGIGVLIETLLLLVFGPNAKTIDSSYATTQIELFGLQIRVSLLVATLVAIAIIAVLTLVLKRTQFGRQVRAASIDADAAALVGIDVKKTYARVMAISAATAAIGGVLIANSYSIAPSSGTGWLLRAFTVIVIGGLGSLPGTLIGGFVVGLVETFGATIFGPQYRDLVVFGVLVIILIARPNGLFAKVRRA